MRYFAPIILFLVVFSGYLFTLAPTITMIDSGELATVCAELGVAHPTGYPLYTLVGRLFSVIPLGSVAYRFNLLSAILATIGVLLFFVLVRSILNCTFSAFATALILAFSRTYWQQAVANEVYILTAVFLIGLMMLLRQFDRTGEGRFFLLFSFLYGLAFTNHLSIIFSVPAVLYLLFYRRRGLLHNLKWIGSGIILFGLGLSLYLYLPLRAGQDPFLNWGDPVTLRRLLDHISGKQYQVWMFSENLEALIARFGEYLQLVGHQFSIALLLLALLGLGIGFFEQRKFTVFLLVLLVFDVGYTLNYSIPDIDPYYLPSFIVLIFGIGFAIQWVTQHLQQVTSRMWVKRLITASSICLFLIPLFLNFRTCDMHRYYFAYDFGLNLLRSAPQKSIVLTRVWDAYSPLLYQQRIERRRPEVVMVDLQLFQNRPWYVRQRLSRFPDVFRKVEPEINEFLMPLDDFSRGYTDTARLSRTYVALLKALAYKNQADYQLYALGLDPAGIEWGFVADFYGARSGVMLHLSPKPATVFMPEFILRGWTDERVYKDDRTNWYRRQYLVP